MDESALAAYARCLQLAGASMTGRFSRILASIVLLLLASSAYSQIGTANAEIERGLSLREKGDYDGAISHLQRATALAPEMVKAHFTLATTAEEICNPNGAHRDSCQLAIREYQAVLRLEPSHEHALKSIAYLFYNFARVDESEGAYRKALAQNPNDAETLCAIGAIDYLRSAQDVMKGKATSNVPGNAPLIDSPDCNQVRSRNLARIEEGIAVLNKSLNTAGANVDVIGFLSALHVLHADMQCGDSTAYSADLNTAKRLSQQWTEQRKTTTQGHAFQKCPPGPPQMPN